jgi:hypothetical protein
VVFDVKLGGFGGVMGGVMMMAMSGVGVMRGEMMIAGFVVACGFAMMAGRVFVMLGCFVMMFGCLLGHFVLLDVWGIGRAGKDKAGLGLLRRDYKGVTVFECGKD